ncbi:MAG: conjugative transposon protein TraM [Bacteroidota bacterium]
METTTLQQQRRRKFLLVAPLLVLPFLTLLFWTFGGGHASAENPMAGQPKGFNSHLPEARIKDERDQSKLGYYDRAAADSAKIRQEQQTDPYARHLADTPSGQSGFGNSVFSSNHPSDLKLTPGRTADDPSLKAAQVNQRIAQLQAVINKPPAPTVPVPAENNRAVETPANKAGNSVAAASTEDPELKQMNGLLEKILDIQHPERLREKSAILGSATAEKFKAIPAVVDGNQKIVQGTVIRMRLLDSVRLNGQLFTKGQLIYGSGDLYNQRVKINIKLIHVGLQIIPVDLAVYDRTDGMEGISVPEAVTSDEIRDGAVNGVQNMDLMSFDPSMTAQLTTAGINTAKGLFAKKVKRVKGKLKNGHELLLRDNVALKNLHRIQEY